MTYRDPDAAGQRRAEAEIAAREALRPLAAEGRARREGRGHATTALARLDRQVELLPAREIDRELELLPVHTVTAMSRALSPPATLDLVKIAGALLLGVASVILAIGETATAALIIPLAVGIAGALATSTAVFRTHREVSWLKSLPFPVRGYVEAFVRDGERMLVDVTVALPVDDRELVVDLIERARGDVTVEVEFVADGLRVVGSAPPPSLLAAFRRALLDEVLVPLHALHPISRVRLRWLRGADAT